MFAAQPTSKKVNQNKSSTGITQKIFVITFLPMQKVNELINYNTNVLFCKIIVYQVGFLNQKQQCFIYPCRKYHQK